MESWRALPTVRCIHRASALRWPACTLSSKLRFIRRQMIRLNYSDTHSTACFFAFAITRTISAYSSYDKVWHSSRSPGVLSSVTIDLLKA